MLVSVRLMRSFIAAALTLGGGDLAWAEDADALKLLPVPVGAAAPPSDSDSAAFVSLFRQWKAVDRVASPSRVEAAGRAPMMAAASRSIGRSLRIPVGGFTMTSAFGMRRHPLLGVFRPHLGIDLAARAGTPVYATADGVVSTAGLRGGYGLSIALAHSGGMETRYGHLSRLAVWAGQRVRKGEVIGFVGSTGVSTGPHLHYETRLNGQAVDPLPYIKRR